MVFAPAKSCFSSALIPCSTSAFEAGADAAGVLPLGSVSSSDGSAAGGAAEAHATHTNAKAKPE
jgi:hypothetical protein